MREFAVSGHSDETGASDRAFGETVRTHDVKCQHCSGPATAAGTVMVRAADGVTMLTLCDDCAQIFQQLAQRARMQKKGR